MSDQHSDDRISSSRVFDGRLLKVDVETIRNPDGQTLELEMVRHPGAVAIVPFLGDLDGPDPQLLMLRQYRYAAGGVIWEIPAGVLEPGEAPEDCARRELREETGAQAGTLRHLTTIFTTPGFTDERIHLFLAAGLSMTEPDHQPDEHIEIVPQTLSATLKMIEDGEIVDAKTLAALLYVAGFTLNR